MKDKKNNKEKENVTDIKGTIVGFIAPDPEEKNQEQEIQDFKLKRETEKELAQLSEEEQKKKRAEYEKLEKVKTELLRSIKERIPAIEKKFKIIEAPSKKGKIVEEVKEKIPKNLQVKEPSFEKIPNKVLRNIMSIIEARSKEVIQKWFDYFGEIKYYC